MYWQNVPRELIVETRVEHYRRMIRSGKQLPAVLVRLCPNGRYYIFDGIQRVEACNREGIDNVYCCVVDCTDDEAHEIRRRLHPFDCQLN